MKVAIMQPYFMPYIGYFQLINAVDIFVVYDNIEFSKKGWINRNRILMNGAAAFFTIPLKKDSDFLYIEQRSLSGSYPIDKIKIINKIKELYKKAPEFNNVFPLIETIFSYSEDNLFKFIHNSIKVLCHYLEIKTDIVIGSSLSINHSLKSQDKVIEICKKLNTIQYFNPIGGIELYSKTDFKENNIQLNFIKSRNIIYKQFDEEFVAWLSIIDVMMFNNQDEIKQMLNQYDIL